MHIGFKNKPYGLVERKKVSTPKGVTSIFQASISDSESDSDSGSSKNSFKKVSAPTNKELLKQGYSSASQKNVERAREEALKEDPTIFLYDEVIDNVKDKTTSKKLKEEEQKDTKREPKYIKAFLESAKQRQKMHELAFEKKLLREQKEDAEKYGNQERFMTESYKNHLVELRKWEAEEDEREKKNQDYSKRIEEIEKSPEFQKLSSSEKQKIRQQLHNQFSSNFFKNIFSTSGRINETIDPDISRKSQNTKLENQKESSNHLDKKRKERQVEEKENESHKEDRGKEREKEKDSTKEENVETKETKQESNESKSESSNTKLTTEQSSSTEIVDTKSREEAISAAKLRYMERKKRKLDT